ncbi:MAG: peptidase C15 [Hyphomicrobiaceae bacterium]|nr:peptidase C15 [Hyphomicrobiaceae bacterium]
MANPKPTTVLITAFGPFPGAPRNPTPGIMARVVAGRLGREPGVRLVPAILATAYKAIDKLDELTERLEPDVVLHLGVAMRARAARVETRARNRAAPYRADGSGQAPKKPMLGTRAPAFRPVRAPVRRMAERMAACGVATELSRDAGDYLCNAALWRSLKLAKRTRRLVGFIHVPATPDIRAPKPIRPDRRPRAVFTEPALATAIEAGLGVMLAGRVASRRG